jgi:hypothetical protein
MGKIVVLILGLALVAFAAKTALDHTAASRAETHSAPRRQLDNVRAKVHDLERQEQDVLDKTAAQADSR